MEINSFIRKLIPFFTRTFSSRPVNGDAGLDHLRQLLLEAHREYQDYVATGVMTLRVFALQFLDGHHYADAGSTTDKNLHCKALGIVSILLLERTDLVERFFTRPSLEAPDIDKVIFLVYTERRDDEKQNPERCIKPVKQRGIPSLNCRIKDEDMILLAECANHAAFFKDKVDSATISNLLLTNHHSHYPQVRF